jgi:hypothetical protein
MAKGIVANNPAGRLRDVLNLFDALGGEHQLNHWWGRIAEQIGKDLDAISVRAEAGALLRELELAVQALPEEDNPQLLLGKRHMWARPIFGIGTTDENYKASDLADAEGLIALNNLHAILRREAPDYAMRSDAELLDSTLDDVREDLTKLVREVTELGEAIPGVLRARLLRGLGRALDDIAFVRFRGYGRLYENLVAAEAETRAVAGHPQIVEHLDQINAVADQLKRAVVSVEQLFLPFAAGVTYGLITGDVLGAIGVTISGRRALGPGKSATSPLQLPPGRTSHDGDGDDELANAQ